MSNEIITIYFADDHPVVIEGLRHLFGNQPQFNVVGTANNGISAQHDILLLQPHIALLDISMPGYTGIEIMQNIKRKVNTKFIILSMFTEPQFVQNAINSGASAYLFKSTGNEQMLHCISKVLQGETIFPELPPDITGEKPIHLSNREIGIMRLIIKGLTNQQIAAELQLSIYTIETHRHNIYRKTNSKSIVDLIQFAKNHGYTA